MRVSGTASIYRRTPGADPDGSASAQHAVGDDLEQRPYGGGVELALVGHGGDAADQAAHLDGVDAVAQRVLGAQPVDDPVGGAARAPGTW